MIVGVIITTSSVWFFWCALLRNSRPRIGMSPMPGILPIVLVTVLFISPAIANVWPSRSSTSVSVRRVDSAGTRKPSMMTALAKSSELTSGLTFRLMRSPPSTVGVKLRRMPNSLNVMVTRVGARAGLHDRIGILAAGEEAGFLAVGRDQVRLGQALEEALVLQRLDRAAEAFLGVEDEQVEEVAEDQSCRSSKIGAGTPGGAVRPIHSFL